MDEVEEIKRRVDTVDLISSYLTLKKAGANYRAICPFHTEKTPSFMVSPEKQIWHCFGCSEGGDIFTFLMKMENLEFPEALKMLADRAGVKLKPRHKIAPEEQPDKKSRLFQLNNLAARVYQQILIKHPSGKIALEYLKKRGLNLETIKTFQIGYTPSSKAMAEYLKKHGFTEQEMENAGRPDRFFRRIIFPITDIMGNTLGFTGRAISDSQEPKYLNTPETIIFHKGRILYNLNRARGEIKQNRATIVVEGQMDVIASHQAEVKNVVASSGTALTNEHLEILYRYTPNIIFAFDSDTAGEITAKKAYEMAIIQGFNVKMVDLGKFKDPGEMAAASPKLWQKQVTEAKPVIDWYFEIGFRGQVSGDNDNNILTSQQKKEIAKEILPIIKKIPDTIEQAHYINLLAKKLAVSEKTIFEALDKVNRSPLTVHRQEKVPVSQTTHLSAEALLLGLLTKYPENLKIAAGKLADDDWVDKLNKTLYQKLKNWYNKNDKKDKPKFINCLNNLESARLKATIFEVENKFPEISDKILLDLVKKMKTQNKEKLKDYYAREIKNAESHNDHEKLKKLMKEFQEALK